jgi:hypothetical protein
MKGFLRVNILKNSFRRDNYNDRKPGKLLPAITNPNARLDLKSSFHERFLKSKDC